jgi:type IV pilus assembly protein PilV
MKKPETNRQRRRAAGFGMVEVLVTLVLLSVGLMGISKLQLVSLRTVHASTVRGQAVLLAYDLADRMRANRKGVVEPDGNAVGFYNSADGATYKAPNDNGCTEGAGAANDCTIAQVAAHDLQEWNDSIAALLPGGTGTVCIDSLVDPTPCDGALTNGAFVYSITVSWTDIEEGGPATKRYAMRLQL